MSLNFSDMAIAAPLQQALSSLNITTPTPVQAEVVTKAIQGGDWMVSSQTGSGKTFAFLLPVMHRMMSEAVSPMDNIKGPEALVLCPTRELAQQVAQDAITLVKHFKGLRISLVVGGMPYGKQMAGLRGARLVVGTPGRLLDLANSGKLNLSNVESLIVDEADRMLDLGFSDDLIALSKLCRARTQTLMFSATFAKHVMGLAHTMMNEPTRIELAPSNETNADISQKLHWTDNPGHKRKVLDHWLRSSDIDQAVIFTSTQQDAERLARDLGDDGFVACALHGAMPQTIRNRRLSSVRRGEVKFLVATDVAARGLDVPAISHVFNFGMPMKAEDYVHRIGRTGRAGRSGIAVTLAGAEDRGKIREIERFISNQIPVEVIEGLEPKPMQRESAGGRGKKTGGRRQGGGQGKSAWGAGQGRSFDERPKRQEGEGRSEWRSSRPDAGRGEWRTERSEGNRGEFRQQPKGAGARGEWRSDRNEGGRVDGGRGEGGRGEWRSDRNEGGRTKFASSRPSQEVKPASDRRRSDSTLSTRTNRDGEQRKPVRSTGLRTEGGRAGFTRKRSI